MKSHKISNHYETHISSKKNIYVEKAPLAPGTASIYNLFIVIITRKYNVQLIIIII